MSRAAIALHSLRLVHQLMWRGRVRLRAQDHHAAHNSAPLVAGVGTTDTSSRKKLPRPRKARGVLDAVAVTVVVRLCPVGGCGRGRDGNKAQYARSNPLGTPPGSYAARSPACRTPQVLSPGSERCGHRARQRTGTGRRAVATVPGVGVGEYHDPTAAHRGCHGPAAEGPGLEAAVGNKVVTRAAAHY